jgi:hypothetical protein
MFSTATSAPSQPTVDSLADASKTANTIETSAETSAAVYQRVNVNFSPDTYDTLAQLAKQKGVTMSEVLRQSISLMKFTEGVISTGGRLLVERNGGSVSELLLR